MKCGKNHIITKEELCQMAGIKNVYVVHSLEELDLNTSPKLNMDEKELEHEVTFIIK